MKSRTIPGKSRILGVCCLLLFGLFVLYHVQQVEDLRLAGMRCDQHELTMRSKFEVEMEKVERLEKRLEVARVSEEKMQQKLRADRDLRDKAMKDSNMRFSSLQQHYKLLQSEHEDVKVEYANLQQSQAMSKKANLATIEEWKSKYSTLESKFTHLEQAMNNKLEGKSADTELMQFKNQQLTDELIEMRKHCAFRVDVVNGDSTQGRSTEGQEVLQRSFDEQQHLGENTYQIPIHIQTLGVAASLTSNNNNSSSSNRTMDLQRDGGVWPIASLSSSTTTTRRSVGGIINSVENFQILPKPLLGGGGSNNNHNNNENVLKEPDLADAIKSKSSTATSDKLQSDSLDRALPIAIAQLQSSTAAASKAGVSVKQHRKVPEGVVPIPESMNALLNHDEPKDILNARYGNVAAADSHKLTAASEEHGQAANFQQNGNEVENGAHEVNDFNIIEEDRNHHDHLQDVLDDEKIVINNNAAEEERGGADEGQGGEKKDKRNEIDLAIINRDLHKEGHHPKKGNDEFVADQGFDDHMEEHVEEEDDDEYPNLAAQQEEGHAVRN